MHTNHTNNPDDKSMLTEKSVNRRRELTEHDWQKAMRLLGLLRLKVEYKRKDLLEDSKKIHKTEVTFLDEMGGSLKEQEVDYQTFTADWEFLLEDEHLISALYNMTDRQQEIVWKMFVEGKSQEEVAEDLSLSPASISQTKKRAYKYLRGVLKNEEE
ncbi:RNA polymerase sigma factor [Jeotgalibaca ciconiae]|uniref:RNA polymerase sigma-70 region 4 domain-containing protein n=1 Tax=Jeotgalibaca ciconiae TaxID=2496265 RepID=A0A3Q9BK56_9LACT|nr:TrfB-related DNA-binding protein [Jeotgalibaca ciconiae]AZP04300.1 hypothetical protein EJN90_06405 [Jeotgalibaca ciconiae]